MNDVQAAASFTKRVYNSHINCNFPARIWQSDDQNNKNESRHWRYQDHNFLPLLVLICQETSSDQDLESEQSVQFPQKRTVFAKSKRF